MGHIVRALAAIIALICVVAIGLPMAAIAYPQPLFAYHVAMGRLALYSDRPFDPAAGRRVLAIIELRLETSALDDHAPHALFVANAPWREALIFNRSLGAGGVNYSPLSRNAFLRPSDIDHDVLFAPSGAPVSPPRTLAYFGAHEITHAFTAERLGADHLWNFGLRRWVREGYADYVAMGGRDDLYELWRRYQAGDPDLDPARSGLYARFRMLTAFMLERQHWSADQLLATRLTEEEALAIMRRSMARGD